MLRYRVRGGEKSVADPNEFEMPERCLLRQALLWVSRGTRPIDDDDFLAAPDKLNESDFEEAKPLIRHLHRGAITASGDLTRYYQGYINESWEDQPEPDTVKNYEPPPFVFSARSIDFEQNSIDVTRFAFFPSGGKALEDVELRKEGGANMSLTEAGSSLVLENLTLPTEVLFKHFAPKNESPGADSSMISPPVGLGTIRGQTECTEWLTELMENGPSRQAKKEYRDEAIDKFSVSWRAFDRAWANAVVKTGNTQWTTPGRKS
jgi:hypothetical protein